MSSSPNPWFNHLISAEEYLAILDEQGGRCAGCSISIEEYQFTKSGLPWWTPRGFEIDHDHGHCERCGNKWNQSCGQSIRGLLCSSCNKRDVLQGTRR